MLLRLQLTSLGSALNVSISVFRDERNLLYMRDFHFFSIKREINFEVATFGGLLHWDVLTAVKFYCYFWRVATFRESLLSVLEVKIYPFIVLYFCKNM